MSQINVSLSFNSKTEQHLLDAVSNGNRSGNVKAAIEFWIKYKEAQLDDPSDLHATIAQMAANQRDMMAMIVKLSEQVERLKSGAIVASEPPKPSHDSWGADMLDMMGDFE